MQRRGRFVEYRSRCRMQMMAARNARPRLPLLVRGVAFERPLGVALRAMRVLAIRRYPRFPEPLQTRFIVWKFVLKLHERVARIR